RAREQRAPQMPPPDPHLDMTVRELRQVVCEELNRLPEKYRAPLVLCYLEGRTQDEAAGQLGWGRGVLRGRLERGRKLVRGGLTRRGLARSAGLFPPVLGRAAAALPAGLAESATTAAARLAAGEPVAVPARVAALAEGVKGAMFTTRTKVLTALVA